MIFELQERKLSRKQKNIYDKRVNSFLPSFEINPSQRWEDMISEVTAQKAMRFSQAN